MAARRKGFQMAMSVNAGARLDRLPISSFHYRIFALVGAGMFFDGYDLYVAGGVLAATIQTNFSTLPQNLQFLSLTFARNPLLRNQLILPDKCCRATTSSLFNHLFCECLACIGHLDAECSRRITVSAWLILLSYNPNYNTGLLHLAGIALAPSAKPGTKSKPLDVFFVGSNLFLGDGRLDKPPEHQRVKAIRIRR